MGGKMNRKDAYLIIAHKQWGLLKELIHSLDYEHNDIFVHIDKKSEIDLSGFENCTKKSKIYLFQKYDVQWGDHTQVDTEMFLFQRAYFSGKYRYYHLLSGQDLPIKPIKEIYHYFDDKDVEFLDIGADYPNKYRVRIGVFHYKGSMLLGQKLFNFVNKINLVLKRDRLTKYNFEMYKGSNWASLTNEAVKYLVEHRRFIRRMTRYSHCADEVYKQVILMNADRQFCINLDEDIRYIDWKHCKGASPHTLQVEDYENLMESKCLFARKFDENAVITEKIIAINR